MDNRSEDIPGVIAPPPLIYLTGLGVGFGLDALHPVPLLPATMAPIIAIALLLLGGIGFVAIFAFRRAQTSANPWRPATALVTGGPFRFTRNPMYVGFTSWFLAATAWRNTAWTLPLLVIVLLVMQWGVIAREESYLERRFGDEYRAYKNKVRRWL